MTALRTLVVGFRAIAPRPSLWATAVRQIVRFVPDRWWQRRPFLPVPDRALLGFRAVTQYGDPAHPPVLADVVAWLRWCKSENQRPRYD